MDIATLGTLIEIDTCLTAVMLAGTLAWLWLLWASNYLEMFIEPARANKWGWVKIKRWFRK
jgi:hypothetical protein